MSISQSEFQNLFVHQKKSESGEQIQFQQSAKNKVIICIYKPSNIKNEQRQQQLSLDNLKENDQVIVKLIYLKLGTNEKKGPAKQVTNLRRAQERQIGVVEHPSVVKAYGIYDLQNEDNQFIVMEKGDYNLKDLLNSNEKLTFMEQIRFITSILSGFACLLGHNLYHLDYKPENFIIFNSKNEGQKQIKLTDFGSSIWIESGKTSEQFVVTGSEEFRAPEINQYQPYCKKPINKPYNAEKCDIYSLGKVFLMIIGQKYSLEDFEIPQEYISLGLKDLINGMLERDPDKRYNFYKVNSLWMSILQKIESKFINAQQVKNALLLSKNQQINDSIQQLYHLQNYYNQWAKPQVLIQGNTDYSEFWKEFENKKENMNKMTWKFVLDMRNIQGQKSIKKTNIKDLNKKLKQMKNLEELALYLEECELNDDMLNSIQEQIYEMKNLKKLEFSQQVNETIVENQAKQYQFDTFTGYDVAKEIIDIIVKKGGEILYDHYLDSRVPEYTQEYFFAQVNSLIGFEYKIQDQQETVFEEIKEENIVKKAYDSKCANALKVEKKVIIMPEQEEEDEAVSEYFQGAGSPIRRFNSTKYSNKSNLGKIRPGNQSIRSVRSKSSQIQSSNDEKNLQQGGKRKKKLENIEELNLIPIQDPVLTESQIQFKKIIDGLRAEQLKLKNQKKQAEADKIKQAELDKLMEKQIKKRIQDLKTKKYTYDFDGNIIFNQFQGKVRNNLKGNQKEIYLEPKIVNGQTQMNQNYKNQLMKQKQNMFDSNKDSMQSSFNNNQKKRVRMQSHDSLNTYGSQNNNNNMDYKNMKMVPEKILGKKQEENWLMQNLGKKSKQVSQQGDRKDNFIDESQKQVDFYNNVQRQTSVIPTIKLQKGVAITELGKDGPKSLKYKEKPGLKKQMNRQQYLEYIENNKFTPGEIYRQKFQQKIIQEQKSEQLEDSLDLENDNLLQEGSLMENSKQMKSITAEDKNKIQDEILKKRMYGNESQQQQEEEDDLDLTVFSQNPLKIRSFHQDSFSQSKFLTDKNRQGKKREVKKIHGIPESYFKGFVESPERKRAISEQQDGQMYKNKNLFKQQQYLQQANKLPSIIKVPTNNLQKKKELYETVIREKRSKTLNEETGHLSMSQKKSTNPVLTKSKKTFGGMATISETLEKSLKSKEIDQSQIKQQEKINIPSKTLMKFLVN